VKPRAITGIGVASPIGTGRTAFLDAMQAGARATPDGGRVEVPGFDPAAHLGDKGLRSLDRLTKLLLVATRLALHDAKLKTEGAWSGFSGEQVGFVCSNAYGSLEAITELDRVATLEDARYINPSRFPLTVANSAAGYASIWEDLRAVNVSVSDGNCGGLDAVACADALVEHDRAKVIVVGGAEAMSDALYLAFQKIGVLSDGAFLGEGAAMVTLEKAEAARARGADVLAEVAGYGTAFYPPERESSLVFPSAEAVQHAVAGALADASITADAVDLVVSGAAGIPAFDEAEHQGVARALASAAHAPAPVLAPKLALGETLGAGGAMGVLTAIAALQGGARGYVVRGDVRTLRTEPRSAPRTVLVTALGYYGNASALVMRAPSR
jgi:3-oxoacyl-(acyl-carrier-protein) synthase